MAVRVAESREAEAALRAQLKVATAGLSAGKDHGDASLLAPAMPQTPGGQARAASGTRNVRRVSLRRVRGRATGAG